MPYILRIITFNTTALAVAKIFIIRIIKSDFKALHQSFKES